VPSLSIEPDEEVEVRGNGAHFIATVKDLLGVRLRDDLMRCNSSAIADGVVVVEYAGNSMKMKRFIVNIDAVDYEGVRNEKKKRLNSMYGVVNATINVHERITFGPGKLYVGTPSALGCCIGSVPEAIRKAIIENEEEKKMHNRFRMEIYSRCAGRYPWRSSNDETAIPKIKKVYFNKPVTVVLWEDGTKTVVKCQPGERYDAEKGLAMAISKKALGNTSKWYDTLKKELENAPKPKKRSSAKKEAADEKA
jgi:hypothetical protein